METDQSSLIDVIEAIGPYVTAILAMIGVFISAWLSQRNWLRQFGKQQSAALLTRRLDLAESLPQKLFEAGQHGLRLTMNLRLAETLSLLNSEGRHFPQDVINRFAQVQAKEANCFNQTMSDVVKMVISVAAFFNDQIHKQVQECIQTLGQTYQSNDDAHKFRIDLRQSVAVDTPPEEVISNLQAALVTNLNPINERISERIGQIAHSMVSYAKTHD